MRKIFNSKSPPKVHACADSRRNFGTTNLKTAVLKVGDRSGGWVTESEVFLSQSGSSALGTRGGLSVQ